MKRKFMIQKTATKTYLIQCDMEKHSLKVLKGSSKAIKKGTAKDSQDLPKNKFQKKVKQC